MELDQGIFLELGGIGCDVGYLGGNDFRPYFSGSLMGFSVFFQRG